MKRVLLFTALIIWSAVASAVVYKWSDADGKIHYGDRPPDGVKAEVVELLSTHSVGAGSAAGTTGAPAAAAPARSAAPSRAPALTVASKEKSATEAGEAAAAREAQCASAQARLQQVTEGRHLFRPGPNGERQYLTSEQIDAERVDAQKEVESVCSGQSSN